MFYYLNCFYYQKYSFFLVTILFPFKSVFVFVHYNKVRPIEVADYVKNFIEFFLFECKTSFYRSLFTTKQTETEVRGYRFNKRKTILCIYCDCFYAIYFF